KMGSRSRFQFESGAGSKWSTYSGWVRDQSEGLHGRVGLGKELFFGLASHDESRVQFRRDSGQSSKSLLDLVHGVLEATLQQQRLQRCDGRTTFVEFRSLQRRWQHRHPHVLPWLNSPTIRRLINSHDDVAL